MSLSAAVAGLLLAAAGVVLCILGFVLLAQRRSWWALLCLVLALAAIAGVVITG